MEEMCLMEIVGQREVEESSDVAVEALVLQRFWRGTTGLTIMRAYRDSEAVGQVLVGLTSIKIFPKQL
jgi:hypothetical protein